MYNVIFCVNSYVCSFVAPGYPYNMDPNYAALSMVVEDGKSVGPTSKDDHGKDSGMINENLKNQSQVIEAGK